MFVAEGGRNGVCFLRRKRSEFARRVKDDPRITESEGVPRARLQFKAIADYETGPASRVTHEQAARAVEEAYKFVAALAALITEGATPDEV